MNSARGYAVEMANEVALCVSDDRDLSGLTITALLANGFEIRNLDSQQFFTVKEVSEVSDLDYCIIYTSRRFMSEIQTADGRAIWQKFVASLVPGIQFFLLTDFGTDLSAVMVPPGSHVCYLGDYLGKKSGGNLLINHFLTGCKKTKSITIPADGLGNVYLLHIDDVAEGIKNFITSPTAPSEMFLVNPEGESLLSLAYHVRSLLPYKIDIVFDESSDWTELKMDWEKIRGQQSKIGWRPIKNYSEILRDYIDYFFTKNSIPEITPPQISRPVPPPPPARLQPVSAFRTQSPQVIAPAKKNVEPPPPVFVPVIPARRSLHLTPLRSHLKIAKPKLPLGWRIAANSMIVAGLLYLFSIVVCATITALAVKNLIKTVSAGGLITESAAKTARAPAVYLQANFTFFTSLPGLKNSLKLRESNRLLSAYILTLQTSVSASELASVGRDIASYVVGEGESDIVNSLNVASLDVAKLYDDLSLLDGSLPADPPSVIPASYNESYISIKSRLQEARRAVLTGKSLLGIAPDLLGVGDRRKYAVLFQNNMELRPTGGFIGSYAIVSLENGKLFDIQVSDVYAADGQLKGHVEPPEEIKKYLGEANWFFRDSNWDPDFPTSARRAEWFLGKTTSQDVQGVIGINLYTLQDVLKALGTIHVEDYGEDITAENIFERAEYHAEVNFFPGSTAKKEFIGSVADTLIGKLRTLPGDKVLDLTRALTKSIDEKNTILALGDTATAHTLSALGWSGELRDLPCPDFGGKCTADYAMLVDSNFGINKANYFLKRQIDLSATINPDLSLSHELKLNYTNTAKSSAWPAGPYKSYSRLYLPSGSVVSEISIDNKKLGKDDIKVSIEHNRTVVGYLLNVPLDATVSVAIRYATPSGLIPSGATYSLYWQKQSGTSADPLLVHIKYPSTLTPGIVSPKGEFVPGALDFSLSNVTDRRITVKFK